MYLNYRYSLPFDTKITETIKFLNTDLNINMYTIVLPCLGLVVQTFRQTINLSI